MHTILQSITRDPRYRRALLGVSEDEFAAIASAIRPGWETARRVRHRREDRKRREGAGPKFTFRTLEDELTVFLLWARLYPTYLVLEALVGGDESTHCRLIQRLTPLLQGMVEFPSHRGRRKIRSLDELREAYPNVWEVIVDATEQRIPRPQGKGENRKYRSGKRKAHTLKVQLLTDTDGRILHVSDSVEGKRHDLTLLRDTLAPSCRNDGLVLFGDRGYQGMDRYLPNLVTLTPVKRNRGKPTLTRTERSFNRQLSRIRITVEHAIGRCKRFHVLAETFRHRRSLHAPVFRAVATIVNLQRTMALAAGQTA